MADDDSLWEDAPDSPSNSLSFDRARHIRFLEMMYHLLPSPYQSQEINRLTLAYFVITGLDILAALDCIEKEAVIHWVLSLQAHPKNEVELNNGQFYGFHGSRSSQYHFTDDGVHEQVAIPNGSHLASTYCALAILKTVGHDLSLVDSKSLLGSMRNLQQPDGRIVGKGQNDLKSTSEDMKNLGTLHNTLSSSLHNTPPLVLFRHAPL